jgi:hypothetical protein
MFPHQWMPETIPNPAYVVFSYISMRDLNAFSILTKHSPHTVTIIFAAKLA